jgi:hypothetical protein
MNNRFISIAAFLILSLLWLGFFVGLVSNQGILDNVWQSFRSSPFLAQFIVGLFTLPVTLGLFFWQTSWPIVLRFLLVLGLAWVSLYTFFPWKPVKEDAREMSEGVPLT